MIVYIINTAKHSPLQHYLRAYFYSMLSNVLLMSEEWGMLGDHFRSGTWYVDSATQWIQLYPLFWCWTLFVFSSSWLLLTSHGHYQQVQISTFALCSTYITRPLPASTDFYVCLVFYLHHKATTSKYRFLRLPCVPVVQL